MSADDITPEQAANVFRRDVHAAETLIDMARKDVDLRGHIAALAVDAGCSPGAVEALERRAMAARKNLLELVRQFGDLVMRLEWAEQKKRERQEAERAR